MESDSEPTKTVQDWEILPSESAHHSPSRNYFHQIQPDYFSLDAQNRSSVDDLDGNSSAHSDNPSWIEPGSDDNPIRFLNKESGEFWSDSSSDQSDERKISGVLVGHDEASFQERELAGEEMKDTGDLGKLFSDSSGIAEASNARNDFAGDSGEFVEGKATLPSEVEAVGEEKPRGECAVYEKAKKTKNELERKEVVWWKMPMEFLKLCAIRMSPLLTVPMAAALMGLVIWSIRMYRMKKKKTTGLQMKITFDDKKLMSRAARLNEAFSMVKRVPAIHPAMPAFGVTSFPAMNLR